MHSVCAAPVMFDVTKMLADALGEHLALTYQRTFGSREPRFAEVIEASARLTIERIVGSDALYHDGDHTALVTLVAQDILRGRFLDKGITPEDWLHMILAALYHDIGYVRGVCSGDRTSAFVIDARGTTIALPRGQPLQSCVCHRARPPPHGSSPWLSYHHSFRRYQRCSLIQGAQMSASSSRYTPAASFGELKPNGLLATIGQTCHSEASSNRNYVLLQLAWTTSWVIAA